MGPLVAQKKLNPFETSQLPNDIMYYVKISIVMLSRLNTQLLVRWLLDENQNLLIYLPRYLSYLKYLSNILRETLQLCMFSSYLMNCVEFQGYVYNFHATGFK